MPYSMGQLDPLEVGGCMSPLGRSLVSLTFRLAWYPFHTNVFGYVQSIITCTDLDNGHNGQAHLSLQPVSYDGCSLRRCLVKTLSIISQRLVMTTTFRPHIYLLFNHY